MTHKDRPAYKRAAQYDRLPWKDVRAVSCGREDWGATVIRFPDAALALPLSRVNGEPIPAHDITRAGVRFQIDAPCL